jgi:hypothetical protein
MDAKVKYTIEFLYTDNNQLYQDDVELTDASTSASRRFSQSSSAPAQSS